MFRKIVFAFAVTLTFAGCGDDDVTGDGGSGNGSAKKFQVRYEATGTFTSDCDFFYITRRADVSPDEENQGGVALQDTDTLPWTLSFEVTVTPLRPFNTAVSAVCADAIEGTAEVIIFIDGVENARGTETGRTVNAEAEFRLVVSQ